MNPRFYVIIFLIVSALLTRCGTNPTGIPTYPILEPSPAVIRSPVASVIVEKNVAELTIIQKWALHDIFSIAWAPNSNSFTAVGRKRGDAHESNLFAYTPGISTPIWSSQALSGSSLTYHPTQPLITVPYFEGMNLFHSHTGKKVAQIDHDYKEAKVQCIGQDAIHYSSDGSRIFTLDTNAKGGSTSIFVWDAKAETCVGKFIEEQGVAFDFTLSREDLFLIIGLTGVPTQPPGSYEDQIHVWNVETGKQVCSIPGAHPLAYASGSQWISITKTYREGEVQLWDAKTCKQVGVFPETGRKSIYSMSFSPDGELLAIGGKSTFQVWSIPKSKLLFETTDLPNRVSILSFSPDGRFLLSETDRVTAEDEAMVILWGIP